MHAVELLNRIHAPWISRITYQLARGEGVRQSFQEELERFFVLLKQSVETGDPAWLVSILDEWAEARLETDTDRQVASLSPLLNQIILLTGEVARDTLSPDQALDVLTSLLPVYTFAFQHITDRETGVIVNNLSVELERARDSFQRLDRSKSDFIAIAAHELKTPLTLIEGYAAMLRNAIPQSDGSSQENILLRGVDNGTRRLREIVDDMIDVSMIDNNMLSLNHQPVWLSQLLGVIRNELTASFSGRQIGLEINSFPGSDEMMIGDGERLYQALRNVISNAIKYTPDNGKIQVDGRKLPGFIEIIIKDNGIGIDPEDHERIFEKFGRIGEASIHSSSKTMFKGGGPGLGLPIAKGIIEAHGGAIWVESPGFDEVKCPGSTFHILLPMRTKPSDLKTER